VVAVVVYEPLRDYEMYNCFGTERFPSEICNIQIDPGCG